MKSPRRPLLSLCVVLTMISPLVGQEWPRFRGPNGTGITQSGHFPVSWTEKDYRWRVALPGEGHGSPVVWGNRLFVTSCLPEDGTQLILCLNTLDGKLIWERRFPSSTYSKNNFNSFASTTPALDADHVYMSWASPEHYRVVALEQRAGQTVWQHDLGPFLAEHGFGASPMLVDDLVILANDQAGKSFVAALNRRDGTLRWKTPRKSQKAAYATPCLYRPREGAAEQLILGSWAHGISSLDPRTGKTLWEYGPFPNRVVGSPILASGLVIASCGSGGGGHLTVAVRPGDPARGIEPELVYEVEKARPYVVTPVTRGPLLFLWADAGIVSCLDAPTGKLHWRKRVGGKFFGSPIRVGERLYALSRDGDAVVLAAEGRYALLGRVPLGEPSHATPAVSDGVMYLRTLSHLMALEGKK